MDIIDAATRSRIMASIRSVSRLELEARPLMRSRNLRNMRHQPKGVYGRPDFANKRQKIAVFIQGCFWHSCEVCRFKKPKFNVEFWEKKLRRNAERHEEVVDRLIGEGWHVFSIWEHEIRGIR